MEQHAQGRQLDLLMPAADWQPSKTPRNFRLRPDLRASPVGVGRSLISLIANA